MSGARMFMRLDILPVKHERPRKARLNMTGTLATPGRSVPWHVAAFPYPVAGGLEPGEKQNWSLAPNQYSGDRDDTVFTVTVRNADGPTGEELFDINYDEAKFEKASRRLETLRESLAKLESRSA